MRLLIALLFLFFSGLVQAQTHYAFTPIQSNDGLFENRVRNITQLPDGRMVIITEGMINLYNGTSFKKISINEENIIPLTGYTGFHHSYVEGDERLWLKNSGKLIIIDLKHERFENQPEKTLAKLGINEPLADFFVDAHQNLWFVTAKGELIGYTKQTEKPEVFLTSVSGLDDRSKVIYDVAVINNQLFLFYDSGLLVCFDIRTRKELYRDYTLHNKPNSYSRTLFVVQHQENLFQLRNGTGGSMMNYNTKSKKWEKVLETGYWLNCLSVDKDDNIWVSSAKGLWLIDKTLQQKTFIPTLPLVDGRSLNNEVSTLYNDNQGGLWIGTFNRGLLYYHAGRFKFKNIGQALFEGATTKEFTVTSFGIDNPDNILVGTTTGLFAYNSLTGKLNNYSKALENVACHTFYKDDQGSLWAGTSKGLYLLEKQKEQNFPIGSVNHISSAGNNCLYVGTEGNGFGILNPATGAYIQAIVRFGERPTSVRQLQQWKQELIGLSEKGLFVYNPAEQSITYPHNNGGGKAAMFMHSNHQYNCLYKDSKGLLWFGTQDGLQVWHEDEKKLFTFNTSNGLGGSSVKAIAEDTAGAIWITTSTGISKIRTAFSGKKVTYAIINYNKFDGIIEGEFQERAIAITPAGALLAGGINGFNERNISASENKPVAFKPVLSGLQVNGIPIKEDVAYEGNIILQNSISHTKEVILNYDQNFVAISFSALNYINPTHTNYQYKLEGVDKSWKRISSSTGEGLVTYTNLEPGTYTFKVKAADNNNNWTGETTTLKLTVKAPLWNTPLARFCYAALSLCLLFLLLKTYLHKSKQRLMREQKEQLDEAKFNFYTTISHELRTPLTLIISPLESLLKKLEPGELKGELQGIHRNSNNLLNLVNQLLDFRRLEVREDALHLTFCNLSDYLNVLCEPFYQLAGSKKIEFRVCIDAPDTHLQLDKEKFRKVVNNLLANAFKFTPEGGAVTVTTRKTLPDEALPEHLLLQVADTGVGIAKKDLAKIFERFQQGSTQLNGTTGSGIGLYLVQEYIKLHKGTVQVESSPNKGACFKILIPLNLGVTLPEPSTVALDGALGKAKLKILLVEDNVEFLSFLSKQLADRYHIITATNGQEGLAKAVTEFPDLVISDLMMPLMTGVELCSRLKADVKTSHVPVILLTARSADDSRLEGYEAGADDFISKPFNTEILLARIKNIMEQQEQRKLIFKRSVAVQPAAITATTVDEKLLERALACVTQNLANTEYSVEQLSSDLHMDRTGLYRKLVSITGQTPTLFIRSIRLKKAAQLLSEKAYTITEISEMVGFKTVPYFSKCFLEEFGVKPSQFMSEQEKVLQYSA